MFHEGKKEEKMFEEMKDRNRKNKENRNQKFLRNTFKTKVQVFIV